MRDYRVAAWVKPCMEGLTQKHAQFRAENYIKRMSLGEIYVSKSFYKYILAVSVHYYCAYTNQVC